MSRKLQLIALSCLATVGFAGTAQAALSEPYLDDADHVANLAERELDAKVEPPKPPKPPKPEFPQAQGGTIEGVPVSTLEAIAACESGGDPTAVNAAGYYGKYQFDETTWASVGGSGNPAEASEAEQDYRAALLYNQAGASPWPVCGQ